MAPRKKREKVASAGSGKPGKISKGTSVPEGYAGEGESSAQAEQNAHPEQSMQASNGKQVERTLMDTEMNDEDEFQDDDDDDDENEEIEDEKKLPKDAADNFTWRTGIADLEPLDTIEKMFEHMLQTISDDGDFKQLLDYGKRIRFGTMCSGTECPIIAMELFEELLAKKGQTLEQEHCFSAEIVPFKQAYIQRNWPNLTVFRNVVELARAVNPDQQEQRSTRRRTKTRNNSLPKAATAYGGQASIPGQLDILVAGFCCVDFSQLNSWKRTLEERGESGDTLYAIIDFIKTQRPKLVLLENVKTAPWKNEELQEKHIKKLEMEYKKENNKTLTTEELEEMNKRGVDQQVLNRGIDLLMAEVGYISKHVLLDAKKYYIPQTRQRGYMLCVDSKMLEIDTKVTEELLEEWERKVKMLAHNASVPAEQIVLAATDEMASSVARFEDFATKKKINNWVSCKAGNDKYRDCLGLGDERKLTSWNEADYKLLPDFWTPMPGMTQRVLDVLEIAHSRSVARGIDDRYYSRLLDLSQNVYRNVDTTPSGIISCLTPSGMPWWTSAGRRIQGREALLIQGLPVNRIDLSYLTEANLQDLTGNAMTATVVGAATIAALATFKAYLLDEHKQPGGEGHKELHVPLDCKELIEMKGDLAAATAENRVLSVKDAMSWAEMTSALCSCEGEIDKMDKAFRRCQICQHTVCLEHGGNCQHRYGEPIDTTKRKFPAEFVEVIKESIPRLIRFHSTSPMESALEKLYPKVQAKNKQEARTTDIGDIESALSSIFLLRSIRRARVWEVTYESSKAKLVLTISKDQVEWLLFAKCPTQLPLSEPRRINLKKFPVARLRPVLKDITKGEWEFWSPKPIEQKVNLKFQGSLVPSFESNRGLAFFTDTYVFSSFHLDAKALGKLQADIAGDYELSQVCGQAFDSLHFRNPREGVATTSSLYFFFDHQPQTGDPKYHHFVFTEEQKKFGFGAYRQNLASLSSDFQYPMVKKVSQEGSVGYKNTTREEISTGTFDANENENGDGILSEEPVDFICQATVKVEGSWVPFEHLSFSTTLPWRINHYQLPKNLASWINTSCNTRRPVYKCQVDIPDSIDTVYQRDTWTIVSQKNETEFYRNCRFLFDKGLVMEHHAEHEEDWQQSPIPESRCDQCAPKLPKILWSWGYDKKKIEAQTQTRVAESSEILPSGLEKERKKQVKSRIRKPRQIPFEDPEEASKYELALKSRPTPFQAIFRIEGSEKPEILDRMTFMIGIDPETLVHRAVSYLASDGNFKDMTGSWRLTTNASSTTGQRPGTYTTKDTKDIDLTGVPENFVKMKAGIRLHPEQMRSLIWQVVQENNIRPFEEEEIVEARVSKLGLRLMGRATRTVTRPGGIIASGVGFGKTAVILGLVQHQKAQDLQRMEAQIDLEGSIASKATLVLVPHHLVKQWVDEASKFLPGKLRIIGIHDYRGLTSKTIQEIQQADIIVMNWNTCESDTYIHHLAQVAGMIDPDEAASARAKTSWHEEALKNLKDNLKVLLMNRKNPSVFDERVHQRIEEDAKSSQENNQPVPSKRVTGSELQQAKAAQKDETSSDIDPRPQDKFDVIQKLDHFTETFAKFKKRVNYSAKDSRPQEWELMNNVVLEMFTFSRVVVDEFPYAVPTHAGENVRRFIVGLSAHAKWLLSGTPPLHSFADIKSMAELIGVHLGIDDYSSLTADDYRQVLSNKTETEKFMLYQPPPSPFWVKRRDELAQRFLDRYLRMDDATCDVECTETVKLLHQPAAERAAYLDVEQHLASNSNQIFRKSYTDSDTDVQMRNALCGHTSGEEALLWRAAHFQYDLAIKADELQISWETANSVCDPIIDVRETNYKAYFDEFERTLKLAEVLQRKEETNDCPHYEDYKQSVKNGFFGDQEVTDTILKMIQDAKNSSEGSQLSDFYRNKGDKRAERQHLDVFREFSSPGNIRSRGKEMPSEVFYLRTAVTNLRTQAAELVRRRRALRIARVVKRCQNQSIEENAFSCAGCAAPVIANTFIVWQCGHQICLKCRDLPGDACPVNGCNATSTGFQPISGSEFTTRDPEENGVIQFSDYGQKIEQLLNLIAYIKNSKECALVFVQNMKAIEKIGEALKKRKVDYRCLDKTSKSLKALFEFQKEISDATVLLLNIGDESAAGMNLTKANHVIFFAPYLTKGSSAKRTYDAAMEQAVGRARRWGQEKHVYVYHFLYTNTIDVDIFEERREEVVEVVTEVAGTKVISRIRRPEDPIPSTLSSHLSGMVLGRNGY